MSIFNGNLTRRISRGKNAQRATMESMAVMRGKGLENDEDNRFPWTRVQMRIKNKIEFETKAAVGCWMCDVCVCSSFLAITLAVSIFAWLINRSENIFIFEKEWKKAIGNKWGRGHEKMQTGRPPKINFVILCKRIFYFRYALVLNNSEKNVRAKRENAGQVGESESTNKKATSVEFLFCFSIHFIH